MQNGSDLRERVTILEQRVSILSKSLEQLVQIVRGIADELATAVGTLNAEALKEREASGQDRSIYLEIDQRLAYLDEALAQLRKP